MLTVTNLADAEYLIGQVALGIYDYCMGAGEAPGVWQGGLAVGHQRRRTPRRLSGPCRSSCRHGRDDKASTVEQIGRFTDHIRHAEAKIARCEDAIDELRPELDRRQQWDAEHGWPDSRLRTVEAELADTGQPARQGVDRGGSLLRRASAPDRPARLDRVAAAPPPPVPGRDAGLGMDLGL